MGILALVVVGVLVLGGALVQRRRSRAPAAVAARDREIADEARTLATLRAGTTTQDIDAVFAKEIAAAGLKPMFHGYNGYPAHCTTSLNDEVINTIPSPERVLRSGDLLKLQVGIAGRRTFAIRGWTYPIGVTTDADQRLLAVGRAALERAVAVVRENARTGDIGHAIQSTAEAAGYTVNRLFVGNRIGRAAHEDPAIPGYGTTGHGRRLEANWVLALSAIVHAGAPGSTVAADGWSCVANDGLRSVLFNHMVVVRMDGGEQLTRART